jgi:membrane-bound serine protease (ClpP class)
MGGGAAVPNNVCQRLPTRYYSQCTATVWILMFALHTTWKVLWLMLLLVATLPTARSQDSETSTTVIENPFDFLPREVPIESTEVAPAVLAADAGLAPLVAQDDRETTEDVPSDVAEKSPVSEPSSVEIPSAEPAREERAVVSVESIDGSRKSTIDGDKVLSGSYERALIIDFNGAIFGPHASYLKNRIERARRSKVDLIILRLTSPGGELETSLELARTLAAIDWATTVAFVPEETISGGAILALGCDRIYMTPRALIGDAGPIQFGPNGQFEHAEEKIVSYLSSAIDEIAEAKGRPGALAQAMVDRSLKVISATDKATGETRYLTNLQAEDAKVQARYNLGPEIVETGQNRFLTVSGNRAVELGLAEGVFTSEDNLLQALTIARISTTRMNWVDKTVFLLNRPWLTGLLLIAGLIGLYIELSAPGIGIAGLTSVACFGIFFWSHALGGTSGWLEVMLFMLGVVCLMVELFLLPGFGVFGLSGILLVLLSLVMATQDFILPNTQLQWAQLQTNTLIVLGSLVIVGVLFMGQLLLLDSIPGLSRFQLNTPGAVDSSTPAMAALTAESVSPGLPIVGDVGVTESVLRPSGKVLFGQQLIDVVSEGEFIDPGVQVEVLRREGNRVVVRAVA